MVEADTFFDAVDKVFHLKTSEVILCCTSGK